MQRKPRPSQAALGGAFEGALEAGLSVAIGAGAGYGADRWLGTFPLFFIVLLILGGVAGVRRLMAISWLPQSPSADPGDSRGERSQDPAARALAAERHDAERDADAD